MGLHPPADGGVAPEVPLGPPPEHGRHHPAAHHLRPDVRGAAFDVGLEDPGDVRPGEHRLERVHVAGEPDLLAEGPEAVLDHQREPEQLHRAVEERQVVVSREGHGAHVGVYGRDAVAPQCQMGQGLVVADPDAGGAVEHRGPGELDVLGAGHILVPEQHEVVVAAPSAHRRRRIRVGDGIQLHPQSPGRGAEHVGRFGVLPALQVGVGNDCASHPPVERRIPLNLVRHHCGRRSFWTRTGTWNGSRAS